MRGLALLKGKLHLQLSTFFFLNIFQARLFFLVLKELHTAMAPRYGTVTKQALYK